jgi:uncharacterized repeat protein (TIGR03809 family)
MTHRLDVARGRDVVARWCALAEARLEHLTELFETGRWRRYHSERAFLENIQEAKAAVETWRGLLTREASFDNAAVDMSWLGGGRSGSPRAERSRDQRLQPQPAEIRTMPVPLDIPIAADTAHVSSDEAPSAPTMHAPDLDTPDLDTPDLEPVLDIAAIAERYPLLRNAL